MKSEHAMNLFTCEKEPLVIDAVRRGDWPDENDVSRADDALWMHAATCPECADTALTAQLLHALNTRDITEATLPNGGLIWWKAQLKAKREAAERATQPISIVEKFFCGCVALSAIALSIWQWNSIAGWFGSVLNGLEAGNYSIPWFLGGLWEKSSPMVIVGATVLLALFTFVGYLVSTEE